MTLYNPCSLAMSRAPDDSFAVFVKKAKDHDEGG